MAGGDSDLKKAVEEFQKKQLQVYRSDPDRILRDANCAVEVIRDHGGRWLLELLQNSEDAQARKVEIHATDDALYVADDGNGFQPDAIKSISGAYLSVKRVGTIGRKGVGFKAVYQVSRNPQVFTKNGGGLEFSLKKAKDWLKVNGLVSDPDKVPYEWLPFYLTVEEADDDFIIEQLPWASTIVKLPFDNCSPDAGIESIRDFPSYGLLPFENLREIRVRSGGLSFDLSISRLAGDLWRVKDSRKDDSDTWRILRESSGPPAEVLAGLETDDRERCREVSFLVGAPVDENGVPQPGADYLPVHVFYETQERAPIRALLHAEFLVKSDRTAIVQDSPFNEWVKKRLATYVIQFVNSQYNKEQPSASLRVLVPFPHRETHETTNSIWERIAQKAEEDLKLPDASGHLVLRCNSATLLSVSVSREMARKILKQTSSKGCLLHEMLDSDKDAREALEALGCQEISDQALIDIIHREAPGKRTDHERVWACWQWLAEWVADKRWHPEERQQRLEKVKQLPLVPVGKVLESMHSLSGRIVTWREKETCQELPEWLPVSFISEWLRDRLLETSKNDPLPGLLSELEIKEPGEDVVKRALAQAITRFWESPDDNPARFLEFLLSERWEEKDDPLVELSDCPVLASVEREPDTNWVRARDLYFGREWGEDLVCELYNGTLGVAWAKPFSQDKEKERKVLERLGVKSCPRVVEDRSAGAKQREESRVVKKLSDHRPYTRICVAQPRILQHLDLESLDLVRARALLCVLAIHWESYYQAQNEAKCEYRYYSWYSSQMPALWWEEVLGKLIPPLVKNDAKPCILSKCWLPDKSTGRAMGKFLPTIHLGAFGEHREKVEKWLLEVVQVRTRIDQVSAEEWWELLGKEIAEIIAPQEAERSPELLHQVCEIAAGLYEACLNWLDCTAPDLLDTRLPIFKRLSRRVCKPFF